MKLRVLITGSRTWPKPWIVETFLDNVMSIVLDEGHDMRLIHGACRKGVDNTADEWAIDVGCAVSRVPANWYLHGKSAGFKRNEFMVDFFRPHFCVAFIHNKSRGATHCARYAKRAGVETIIARIND